MPYIDSAAIKVNGCNQAIFIPADIENNPVLDFISRRKNGPQFREIVEISFLHNFEPARKVCLAIRIFFPELDESLARDNMHNESLSRFEI